MICVVDHAPAQAGQGPGDPGTDPSLEICLTEVASAEREMGADSAPVVLAWTAGDCPMAKVYAPRLRALAGEFTQRGVRFFLVDSSSDATAEKLRATAGDVPVICDERGELARLAGARSTTEVIVLDREGGVAYRGAVDDQYGFRRGEGLGAGTFRKDAPAKQYLREAELEVNRKRARLEAVREEEKRLRDTVLRREAEIRGLDEDVVGVEVATFDGGTVVTPPYGELVHFDLVGAMVGFRVGVTLVWCWQFSSSKTARVIGAATMEKYIA